MKDKLNDIKRIVLSVLTYQESATGYTLCKDISEVWPVTHQQLYRELAQLTESGYIEFQVQQQQGKPDKKCYSLTAYATEQAEEINKQPIGDFTYKRSSSIAHVLGTSDPEALVQKLNVYLKKLKKDKNKFDRMEAMSKKNNTSMPIVHKRGQLLLGAEIEWVETVLSKFEE